MSVNVHGSRWLIVRTYGDQKYRHSRQHGQHKDQRHDLGRALGVRSESVADERLLAVAQRCLMRGLRRSGIELDSEVENRDDRCFGGAEGSDDDGSSERGGRLEELDGEVFLRLETRYSQLRYTSLSGWGLTSSTVALPEDLIVSG